MKRPLAPGWPKETGALLLALAAGAFMVGALRAGPQHWRAAVDPEALDSSEAILTGYAPPRVDPSDRMPLGQLLEDFAVFHAYPSRERLLIASALAFTSAFVFALAEQLGPMPCGLLAVIVWGWFFMRRLPVNPAFCRQALYAPFVLLTAALLAWRARTPTPAREKSVWLACAAGASLLVRSPLAFFLPLFTAYEWGVRRHFSIKTYRAHFAALCLIPVLFLLPWIRMNWVLQGRLAPFESGAAVKALVPAALGAVTSFDAADAQPLVSGSPLSWALRETLSHPLRYARGAADRLIFIFSLSPVLFVLAALAAWLFRHREPVRQTGLLALYFILIHAAVGVSEYYLYPLWPILCALAAALPFGLLPAPKKEALPWVSRLILGAGVAGALALSALTGGLVSAYAHEAGLRDPRSDQALQEALERRSADPWLLYQSGALALSRGDAAGALAPFSFAARFRPDMPQFRLGLACAQALNGKTLPLFTQDWQPLPAVIGEAPSPLEVRAADGATLCKAAADLRSGRRARARGELEEALSVWAQAQGRNQVRSARDLALDERLSGISDSSFPNQIGVLLPYLPPRARAALLEELALMRPADAGIAQALAAERRPPAATRPAPPPVNAADALIEAAQKARGSGDAAGALSLLDQAAGSAPDMARSRRIALLYQDFGAQDKALALLSALAARYPGDALILKDLGICQYGAGQTQAARRSLLAALAADPSLKEAARSLAAINDSKEQGR